MKNCLFILLLFVWQCAFSQFNDNFTDGNFTHAPIWYGDQSSFLINNTGQLQTRFSPLSQSVSLATKNELASSVRWEFSVRLDFDPSSGNRLRVYLVSDQENLNEPLQGYFIQIGETGSADSYDLYRQSGTTIVKILDGLEQPRANPDQLIGRIRVTRDEDGNWELEVDSNGGTQYTPAGTVTDDTFLETGWFGVMCQYTATRSDKFYLDDFSVGPWQSTLPPRYKAALNDIVINEIFADPEPPQQLPVAEFIELWNQTTHNISLKNWSYSDAVSSYTFGNETIMAGEYLVLCAKADTARFSRFGRVIGISPWPGLNNSSDRLSLKDQQSRLINEVAYFDTWYGDSRKKEGGFSLELMDPASLCSGMRNWGASMDPAGGTPGKMNSIYKLADNSEPLKITKAALLDSVSLLLSFNRYTDSLSATNARNYLLNNGAGSPESASYAMSDLLTVILKFTNPLTRGNFYTVSVTLVRDCNGTVIESSLNSFDFSLPKQITRGDVLISEILFNPRAGGVDFVEIYNHSDHELDIGELYIGNLPFPDSLNKARRVSTEQRLLKPREFLVLTADPEKIMSQYTTDHPQAFIKITSFPTYNNDKGIVTLLRNSELIDELSYTEKMHSPLIKSPDGISLERSDFNAAANKPGNFRSAAASAGFATPGYKNSQSVQEPGIKDTFTLSSTTFSPDNDGFEDLLQIDYLLSKPGFVANITVYNSSGRIIRKLYRGYSLATSGVLNWDGRDESSEMSAAGIYLFYAELFNAEGEVKKFRKSVVLARKLN